MVKPLVSTTVVTFPLFWEIANGCGGTALLTPNTPVTWKHRPSKKIFFWHITHFRIQHFAHNTQELQQINCAMLYQLLNK